MEAPVIEFRGALALRELAAPSARTLIRPRPRLAGEVYKRSEWLRNWNRRELVVSNRLLSWFSGEGRQTGSLVLEKNCFITTTVDGRLVVQSAGREVQFRCHDRARLSDWLRAVQSAARPAPPGDVPSSLVADCLPTSAALSTFADAIGAPSCSPPPPPQLLSKEAIAQINWGKVGATSPRLSPPAIEARPHPAQRAARLTASRRSVLADGLQTHAHQPLQEPQPSRHGQWIELESRHDAGRIQGAGLTQEPIPRRAADQRHAGQRGRCGTPAARHGAGTGRVAHVSLHGFIAA